jgi:beta-ketoacyl-acyl-carrier-protein synthase II
MPIYRPDDQRVVITGVGAITPLGLTMVETWEGLLAGRSGIGPVTQFDASHLPIRIAGEVKGFEPAQYMDPKEARRIARCSQLAIATLKETLADAGLPERLEDEEGERAGVVIGTAVGGIERASAEIEAFHAHRRPDKVGPFAGASILPNMPAYHVSLLAHALGPSFTIVTACASGTQAVGEAAECIRRGAADLIICGGVDSLIQDFSLAAFCAMRALSARNDCPEEASRPFDKDRDGFVVSDGCALAVLESLPHARARGARIYAEVLGQASSSDAYHIAAPDPTAAGAVRAMRWALQDAGVDTSQVGYINAHGTSTPLNDATETMAIKILFGEAAYQIPISSTKSMLGHAMGAAGAVEAIVCALTIYHGVIHPTINYRTPDPECDLDYVPNTARRPAQRVRVALSNSFGLGGQNACLVLGALE